MAPEGAAVPPSEPVAKTFPPLSTFDRLRQIDARLKALPQGTLETHVRGTDRVVFRICKEGSRTRFHRVGWEGSPEHLQAVAMLEERRELARERRNLAREAL
jgi:hypothetical protein